jgi:hypothetical protein
LEDAKSFSVRRKDMKNVFALGGLQQVLLRTEIIDDFLVKEVDSRAKNALQRTLEQSTKKP